MKWPFSKSSQSGASDLPPETRRQYERLYEILHNEALQNEPYPESLKSRMSAGSDTNQNPDGFGYFGTSQSNPIPVNGPIGEILYLSSLRAGGKRLLFHRLKSINEIDVFESVCIDGSRWGILYLDMYHPRKSRRAPEGYAIAEDNALLSGVTYKVEDFPQALYAGVVAYSEKRFGMSIADPNIRIAIGNHTFDRSSLHLKKLGEIEGHSKDLVEEIANETIGAQTGIYDTLMDFHHGMVDGKSWLPKERIRFTEIVFFALTASIHSIFRWQVKDATALADKICEKVIRLNIESGGIQMPMGEAVRAFRRRFPIYRDALFKLQDDQTAFGLLLSREFCGQESPVIGLALCTVALIALTTIKEIIQE